MSQPDALAQLRSHRPLAPVELRDRVRLIAVREPVRPRRLGFTWRRASLVLAPALVGVLAVTIAIRGRDHGQRQVERALPATQHLAPRASTEKTLKTYDRPAVTGAALGANAPAPNLRRIENYNAYLRLRVHDGDAVSDAAKRAVAVARGLGGYASFVSVDNGGREGSAEIRLRVPISRVQDAVARLSSLGTIVGEQVQIQDLTASANAVDREIARLQRRLRDLRAQPQTDDVKRRIESLTKAVERLQRGRAQTLRSARLATISLELTTREATPAPKPHHSSRLDGAWTALGWIGIAALYGLIVGAPFALLAAIAWTGWRIGKRRAEARLLAQP